MKEFLYGLVIVLLGLASVVYLVYSVNECSKSGGQAVRGVLGYVCVKG